MATEEGPTSPGGAPRSRDGRTAAVQREGGPNGSFHVSGAGVMSRRPGTSDCDLRAAHPEVGTTAALPLEPVSARTSYPLRRRRAIVASGRWRRLPESPVLGLASKHVTQPAVSVSGLDSRPLLVPGIRRHHDLPEARLEAPSIALIVSTADDVLASIQGHQEAFCELSARNWFRSHAFVSLAAPERSQRWSELQPRGRASPICRASPACGGRISPLPRGPHIEAWLKRPAAFGQQVDMHQEPGHLGRSASGRAHWQADRFPMGPPPRKI